MLTILRRIVQEVNAAKNLKEALNIMVARVAEAVQTECCSIYLTDYANQRHVLVATIGMPQNIVGKVSLKFSEGLVGLVADREEPIHVEDAEHHPHFLYVPETKEERYRAFLGVPITHQRKVLGVLVVQQRKKRKFDEGEEAFVVTISAQLAGVIAHAEMAGDIPAYYRVGAPREATVIGVPGAPGVAIGNAVAVYPPADLDAVPDRKVEDVEYEIRYFQQALQHARDEIHLLSLRMANTLPKEEQLLFEAYLQILDSNSIGNEVEVEIRKGNWAAGALRDVIKQHVRLFEAMEDGYLRERAADIKDLGRRVLRHLTSHQSSVTSYPEHTILLSEELTAASLAEVPEGRLVAVVSVRGSANSHVAILARALGIPAVMGADTLKVSKFDGIELIVDGYSGEVFAEPSVRLRKEYRRLLEEEKKLVQVLSEMRDRLAETPDGRHVPLCVNTGLVADIRPSLEVGAEGVGLYRTEVPFMIRERFPGEEEQREIYSHLLKSFAPNPVTIRTLDVGGDKSLPYFPINEENPFLGWRGIRITLDHPEIFLVQMRSMLRASLGLNNMRVLLPMVSCIAEVKEAKRLIMKAYAELLEEYPSLQMPPIGVMIEVPSAVYQAREIARHVDFLSVGSNDLIQYLLAVDRNNARVANIYDSFNPSVLRALLQVVEAGHAENKIVSICGEMAGEPIATVLLLAMGFDMLSMNSTSLPRVKWVIRSFTLEHAREILNHCLTLEEGAEIRAYLERALEEVGLGSLVH